MKDMQYPDKLNVISGSRKVLWSTGSKIVSVGNCFSAAGFVAAQK